MTRLIYIACTKARFTCEWSWVWVFVSFIIAHWCQLAPAS